ncbi:hypothetical protein AVEN_22101-1 [Araneus ventricosus]|uniref:Uncharacterized protein n=1 Tax=Araneus ventricosus TaxID=182803 RepID=A0A4Y2NQA8_ARAVE|nr:hypothetical protein AVEN_22101-1 [Araneus ventricosus]
MQIRDGTPEHFISTAAPYKPQTNPLRSLDPLLHLLRPPPLSKEPPPAPISSEAREPHPSQHESTSVAFQNLLPEVEMERLDAQTGWKSKLSPTSIIF